MTFFQEQSPRQPFLRAPAAVLWLIAVLIGVYAVLTGFFGQTINELYWNYGFVPARYWALYLHQRGINPGGILDRTLPFVTYIFLHGSWTHVIVNSVWLLAFGPVVARRFGTLLFLGFFLVCGIAGACAHLGYEVLRVSMHWSPEQELMAPAVGASAAISGLMGAGFRMLPLDRSGMRRPIEPILSPRILIWSALWIAVNIVVGVTGLGTGAQVQLVAWAAHLGGYAAGLLLAGPFDTLAGRWMRERPS